MLTLVLWQRVVCIVWVVYCSEWAWLWMCVRMAVTLVSRYTSHNAYP